MGRMRLFFCGRLIVLISMMSHYVIRQRMKSFEGLAEGEHKQALESARKMLAKGYNKAYVSDITGLSIEEIEKLKMV